MHLCAADCCDKPDSSVDKVHRCIENCSTPLTQAQSFVQNELSHFQVRIFIISLLILILLFYLLLLCFWF